MLFKVFRIVKRLNLDKILFIKGSTYPFTDYFKGLEKVEAVRRIFGEETEEVLRNLKVQFTSLGGYMGVNPFNGHLMVNPKYLTEGDRLDIYLDLIHELVHVRQFMEGKELFDASYDYVERPTEVEAYRYAVEEAKRLGKTDETICKYLKTEWMSDEDLRLLAKAQNIKCE